MIGMAAIGTYTVTCTVTDDNSIGDPAGVKSASYTLIISVIDYNYAPVFASSSITDMSVALFASD